VDEAVRKPRIAGPRCGEQTARRQSFMAAKHVKDRSGAPVAPNRRAGGRPGDARRPAAFDPRGGEMPLDMPFLDGQQEGGQSR